MGTAALSFGITICFLNAKQVVMALFALFISIGATGHKKMRRMLVSEFTHGACKHKDAQNHGHF